VVKAGRLFEAPAARLQAMHAHAFRHRSSSASAPSVRIPDDVVHSLTDLVTVNEQGQITSLHPSIDLAAPPRIDPTLPHAPRRLTHLTKAEEELAITNALKYFHKDLHAKLRPICRHELDTYGHIYFYHLLPQKHLWAIPFDCIPGNTLEARAMTHMILNNLDPAVAQFPQELITYGGNGAVFGNWAQFHITTRLLARMHAGQSLCMSSGHPQGLFPKRPESATPAAVISNGNMIPNYSTPVMLDRLYALGTSMYGQMTAGSWMYIGPQGIVHGTTLTVAQAIAMQASSGSSGTPAAATSDFSCRGKVFVTSGLGGMSGAQPKAATINGAVCIVAEVDKNALIKRHQQGWLNEYFTSLDDLMARAKAAQEAGEAVSLGYLGNIVDLWEHIASTPLSKRPSIAVGSDQTSLHNPYNGGYYPVGMPFDEANRLMTSDPEKYKAAIQATLHRHMGAIQKLRQSDNMLFFDYGNAFLLECHRAGCNVDPSIPSYVECIMGPEFFDYGFGPYRWVCTSGDISELELTDRVAEGVLREQMADSGNARVLPQLQANLDWIQTAMSNRLVVGSKARILYSDLDGRIECAVRMNRLVASGAVSAPIVIGRDHHDVSGTDAPWRETANMRDGSSQTADMAVQNVIGDAMR
jgi:urocanate hydratase